MNQTCAKAYNSKTVFIFFLKREEDGFLESASDAVLKLNSTDVGNKKDIIILNKNYKGYNYG